jgi:pimeloyl-ACP methyl ester carboxylesterase
MIYTRLFPEDVAGLVFVDTSHPDQTERLKSVITLKPKDQIPLMRALDYLSWTGVTRLLSGMSQGEIPNQPAVVAEAATAYAPSSITAVGAELENLEATLTAGGELRTLGDRPLYVLTAAAPLPQAMLDALAMTPAQEQEFHVLWTELQAEEAAWSSNSQHVLVPEAMHYIQFDAPEKVVTGVDWVVDHVRAAESPQSEPAQTEPAHSEPAQSELRGVTESEGR